MRSHDVTKESLRDELNSLIQRAVNAGFGIELDQNCEVSDSVDDADVFKFHAPTLDKNGRAIVRQEYEAIADVTVAIGADRESLFVVIDGIHVLEIKSPLIEIRDWVLPEGHQIILSFNKAPANKGGAS